MPVKEQSRPTAPDAASIRESTPKAHQEITKESLLPELLTLFREYVAQQWQVIGPEESSFFLEKTGETAPWRKSPWADRITLSVATVGIELWLNQGKLSSEGQKLTHWAIWMMQEGFCQTDEEVLIRTEVLLGDAAAE